MFGSVDISVYIYISINLNDKIMNVQTIKRLQKENGYYGLQQRIDNGSIWKMEGSAGRDAMEALRVGVCMLPKEDHLDYYGNLVPSRDRLKAGTKGTYRNSASFWGKVQSGEVFIDEEEGIIG